MADTHTWVQHAVTGGLWLCPTEALDDYRDLGWEPTDERPAEINPAIAEMLAWRQAQAQESKSTAAPRGKSKEQ